MNDVFTTAGIDIGSAAVKVAILRSRAGEEGEMLAGLNERIRRRDLAEVIRTSFEQACRQAKVEPPQLDYVATTGDADTVTFRTGHFYSMTAHARGATFLMPASRAVVDVGALHARAIKIDERGRVLAHRMTSQCASGSGQFLENIARYLGVPMEDVGGLSVQGKQPEKVSSICAVLAETDVINMVSRGIRTEDILKGIHVSIAGRLARLLRAIGSEGTVFVTGGLSYDLGLLAALKSELDSDIGQATIEVANHPDGVLAGAIGSALFGSFRKAQLRRQGRDFLSSGAVSGVA